MKKEIIGKILVVFAMACLTFIFAALSVHYSVFAVSFRDTPFDWTDMLVGFGALAFVGIIGLGITCLIAPPATAIFLLPFEMWRYISEKHGKWQHLINMFLLVLCVAFIAYAINLVTILEYLSGEKFKQMPTLGGFLTVMYAWIVIFGIIILYGWLSNLTDAFVAFLRMCAEAEENYNAEQKKKAKRQEIRREQNKKKRIVYTKL